MKEQQQEQIQMPYKTDSAQHPQIRKKNHNNNIKRVPNAT